MPQQFCCPFVGGCGWCLHKGITLSADLPGIHQHNSRCRIPNLSFLSRMAVASLTVQEDQHPTRSLPGGPLCYRTKSSASMLHQCTSVLALGFGPSTREGEGTKLVIAIIGLLSIVSFSLSSLFGGTTRANGGKAYPRKQVHFPRKASVLMAKWSGCQLM